MEAHNKKFLVVNAFADGPFGGNPAAVFPEATDLDSDTMQSFARQLNLVESVFVMPAHCGADFRLRYFTPNGEIPVAGHPTIAAWLALIHQQMIEGDSRTNYRQVNLAGTQEIEIDYTDLQKPVVTMRQPAPAFLECVDSVCDRASVAAVFGLDDQDLHPELPIRAIDTGLVIS